VFKLVSSIAAADSAVYPFERTNNCTGTWYGEQYGDTTRTDWFREGHGVLDGLGAIINSCNPYYWQLGVALQNADPFLLPNYARMFGFGSRTGLRGIEEDEGLVQDPDYYASLGLTWGQSATSNLVIGQGELAVNPLQVARMVAVIASDGRLYTPYLVDRVQLIGEDPSYVHQPEFADLDLDSEVLADVRQAMCDVTLTPTGTARFIFSEWYTYQNNAVIVCGKTGTAQSGQGTQPHAWFAAFAPAEDPQIAIAVIVENSCEGSEVAAHITRAVVELYFGLDTNFGWPALWQGACSEIVVE